PRIGNRSISITERHTFRSGSATQRQRGSTINRGRKGGSRAQEKQRERQTKRLPEVASTGLPENPGSPGKPISSLAWPEGGRQAYRPRRSRSLSRPVRRR